MSALATEPLPEPDPQRAVHPEARPSMDLRIAMVAPPFIEVPPASYGGIEGLCAVLVDALIDRGHDVTLFGVGRNGTRARFVRTLDERRDRRIGQALPELRHAAAVQRVLESEHFDVVHDHTLAGLLLATHRAAPTVATMHGPVDDTTGEYVRALDGLDLVAISEDQRRRAPHLPWLGTVHNAVRVADYPFGGRKEDFVLFLGRCCADKGLAEAIVACRAVGRRLVVAAKCRDPEERRYYDESIVPLLGPDVTWLGEVGGRDKTDLLSRARCLLFPIAWDEPFGLVMIEALSCGTPVVATARGAVPEVVRDGCTGFVTADVERLPRLIEQVDRLDPRACRADAEQRFDATPMAAAYERLYLDAIESRRAESRIATPGRIGPAALSA